jgi:acylphosphatase
MPKPKKEEVSEQFKRAKEPALAIGAQPTDKKLSKEFSRGDVIVVKFKEGSRIRLEGGKFNFQPGNITESDLSLLERGKINLDKVKSGIQKVKKLVEDDPEITLERMFKRNEAELEKEKISGEINTGEELADPNLYYYVYTRQPNYEKAEKLVNQLNELDIVEIAYPQPVSEPAAVDLAPTTAQLTARQGYLEAAPAGINARYAWTFNGGKGAGVRIIDVENGWHLDHEDLPRTFVGGNSAFFPFIPDSHIQHGTAVLGVVAAAENRYGMTGIVPQAAIGVSTVVRASFTPVPSAIDDAAGQLRAGDIIIIEQHAKGPSSGRPCDDGNCTQWEFVCQEYWQADFDAIRRATARGIIVVEAAGNGGMDLDSPIYGGRFNRSVRDSGAILVGAGTSGGRVPHAWSNFGSRVDVQGWGDSVATLGYGDSGAWSRVNGNDVRQFYTGGFSGTSSASPIVAGAVAAIQGILRTRSLPVLGPITMRNILRSTGTAQGSSPRQIGPLPNIRAALNALGIFPPAAPGWPSLGGVIISSPAISRNSDGRLEVFAIGVDNCLYHIWQTAPNNGWSGWGRLGNLRVKGTINVIRSNDGRIEVFARGEDNAIWHIWQTAPNNGWSNWESLGGNKTSSPSAVVNNDGRMEVFAKGTDNAIWQKYQTWANGPWWPVFGLWNSMGGVLTSPPVAARNGDGRLEIFARGTDNAIWHRWQVSPGGNFSGWASLGGVLTSDPIVGVNADRRLEVFALGTDNAMWHIWQTAPNNGWSGWESLGGNFPAGHVGSVTRNSAGRLEVFARGRDNAVYHNQQIATPPFWSGWQSLGGNTQGTPVAFINADGRMEVMAQGSDSSLVHRWQPW